MHVDVIIFSARPKPKINEVVAMDADASLEMNVQVNLRKSAQRNVNLAVRTLPLVRRLTFALFAISTFIGQLTHAAQPLPLADVPIVMVNALPCVEVHFGKRGVSECIVDTGSDIGLANSELSRGANSLGRSKVVVAGRRPLSMPLVEIRDVAIGMASVKSVRFGVGDRSWADAAIAMPCVVGGSFLDRFTVDLDFAAGRLRLFERGRRISTLIGSHFAEDYDLTAHASYGGIVFDTIVDGKTTRAFLDTGWPQSSANAALLEVLNIQPDDSRIELKQSALRSGGQRTERLLDLGPIEIGKVTIPLHPIDVGGYAASLADRKHGPFLHVGSDLLAGYRLLIDAGHRQVVLLPGAAID